MLLEQSDTTGKPPASYPASPYSPPDIGRGAWRGGEISSTQHFFEGLQSSILISVLSMICTNRYRGHIYHQNILR